MTAPTVPDGLMAEAADRARRVGISASLMAAALVAHRGARAFVVEIEDKTAGGSFYRVTQEGPTRVLYLNIGHPFYATIYDPPGSTAQHRAFIETFLWILGTSELDAPEDRRVTYARERQRWSRDLATAAPLLDELLGYPDERAALAAAETDDDAEA